MPKTSQTSAKQAFLWNLLGSLSTGLISFCLLFVVTTFLSDGEADIYSFAYALANQLSIIGLFQIRNYQSTDVSEKYSFSTYLTARLLTCFVMILSGLVLVLVKNYDATKSFVILLITLYRLTDALSDVFQGLFQQHNRIDLAGKSLFYRNSLVFIVFFSLIVVTRQLELALMAVSLVSLLFIFWFDIRQMTLIQKLGIEPLNAKIFDLLKQCFPFFVNGFIIVQIYNQPKYSLERAFDLGLLETGVQKDFNIIFMPVFVTTMLMLVVRPLLTHMAIALSKRQQDVLINLQKKIFLYMSLISLAVVIGSYFLGLPILGAIYSSQLGHYQDSFLILMIASVFNMFAIIMDNILTVYRQQKLLLITYGVSLVVTLSVANTLVARYQVLGASLLFLISMVVWCAALAIIYIIILNKEKV